MNAWTKTEPSPAPKGPWFKALAEKLKAWWESLFAAPDESGDAEIGNASIETLPSLNPSAHENQQAAVADSHRDDDPLADWMALVAEGAPELLIAPEEGGTPWVTAPEAMPEISEDPEDTTGSSTPFAHRTLIKPQAEQWPRPPEAPAVIRNSASENWPWTSVAKPDSGIPSVPSTSKVSQRFAHLERSFPPNDAMAARPPVGDDSAELERPRPSTHSDKVRSIEDRMSTAQRGAGEPFSSNQTRRPALPEAARFGATENRPSRPGPNIAGSPGSSKEAAGGSRGSSQVLPIFPVLPGTGRHRESRTVTGQNEKRTPVRPAQKTDSGESWTPMSAPAARQEGPPTPGHRNLSFSGEVKPIQSMWSDDPGLWPELPEDQPLSESNWMESYIRHEHIQALDDEQRGGR